MKVYVLIPARSGSKGLKDKNIKPLCGKPLIAWSIEVANKAKIDKVIVSTDSNEYRDIAIKYGAWCPFLRPKNISGDNSKDIEYMSHLLRWLENNDEIPDLIVHLRPTYPKRNSSELNKMIDIMINHPEYSSLRTVTISNKSPYKMYYIENCELVPLFKTYNDIKEPYNDLRQNLPEIYIHNGCVDIIRTDTILNGSMTGEKIYPYLMEEENIDIDTEEDFNKAELLLRS